MTKQWMQSLVRARQLQEDVAKERLATAQRLAHRAHGRVRYNAERIDSLRAAGAADSATAFVAAAVAMQAAAATHSAAERVCDDAALGVLDRRDELGAAARARRTAEELHERQLVLQRAHAASAAQREMDEIAARVHRGNAGVNR